MPRLHCVKVFKACEKFHAEKQSVKGRFSYDGRLFFANCVAPDEAHIYAVPRRSSINIEGGVSNDNVFPIKTNTLTSEGDSIQEMSESHTTDFVEKDQSAASLTVTETNQIPALAAHQVLSHSIIPLISPPPPLSTLDLEPVWACIIIFDRTYTSGMPLFSPNSRWFSYNGELYDTEDWSCVSETWSEARLRVDKDTMTGRYLDDEVFITDSSEADERGLI